MVFSSGRGRPPIGNTIVGNVDWDGEAKCWAASNGYYWHGTKLGGWRKDIPDPDLTPDEKRRKIEVEGGGKLPRARPPNGNDVTGTDVSYNFELKCYETNLGYYWHGTFKGGWKKYAPGQTPQPGEEDDNGANPRGQGSGTGNTKGRRPRPPMEGVDVRYDNERQRWVSSTGLVWLGTYNGGWKDVEGVVLPPTPTATATATATATGNDTATAFTTTPTTTPVEGQLQGQVIKTNKKGRRPAPPKGGGVVQYNDEKGCWACPTLGLFWHGSHRRAGWKNYAPGEGPADVVVAEEDVQDVPPPPQPGKDDEETESEEEETAPADGFE